MTQKSNSDLMLPDDLIISKIYLVRGEKVMLDRDLAKLFDVKAIRLREQVKRNIEKFPVHFMFQLTNGEVEIMVSQNAIPSKQYLVVFDSLAVHLGRLDNLNDTTAVHLGRLDNLNDTTTVHLGRLDNLNDKIGRAHV